MSALKLLSAEAIDNMVESAMEDLKANLEAKVQEMHALERQLIEDASDRETAVLDREVAVNAREMALLVREANMNDRERNLNARQHAANSQSNGMSLRIGQLEQQREALVTQIATIIYYARQRSVPFRSRNDESLDNELTQLPALNEEIAIMVHEELESIR
jgi:hypothetical protein